MRLALFALLLCIAGCSKPAEPTTAVPTPNPAPEQPPAPLDPVETDSATAVKAIQAAGGVVRHDASGKGIAIVLWGPPDSNARVTDADMKFLTPIANVTEIIVVDNPITNATVQRIVRHTGLKRLNLRGTNITDAALKQLAPLKSLVELDLSNTSVTDDGVKELSHLTALTELSLMSCPDVTGSGLKDLASLKLIRLSIGWSGVNDEGLKGIAACRGLTYLHLSRTRVTDAGLKEIAQLQSLTKLQLWQTLITDAGIPELTKLTALTDLGLGATRITEAGEREVKKAIPKVYITRQQW